jgi:hypothetical protein
MTNQVMTLLGAIGAMLAVIQLGLPENTSWSVKLGVAAVNAGLSYYLGQTNKGTTPQAPQQVEMTVSQAPDQPPTIVKP